MKKSVLLSLGAAGVVLISAASIYQILTPKTECVDEVIEITNASNVSASVLLAPQPALDVLKSNLLPRTATDKIDNVIVAAGITQDMVATFVLMKVLIDENTSKGDSVLQEVESALHKQPHQCRLSGKTYNIYIGKTATNLD